MQISVRVNGPLFSKRIDGTVKAAIVTEALEKIGKRMERGGKGLGAKRNIISRRRQELEMEVSSTLRSPRTRGTAWTRKNMRIVGSMAPRVLRKAAQRIVEELG